MNKKQLKIATERWGNSQKVPPELIVFHYIDKGHHMWNTITIEQLENTIKQAYKEEKENEEKGIIKVISASFTETLSRGAWELARMADDLRVEIVKTFYRG